jgi:hypothetical protein
MKTISRQSMPAVVCCRNKFGTATICPNAACSAAPHRLGHAPRLGARRASNTVCAARRRRVRLSGRRAALLRAGAVARETPRRRARPPPNHRHEPLTTVTPRVPGPSSTFLGAWLVLAPWFLAENTDASRWNDVLSGIAVILLSMPLGRLRDHYGTSIDWWCGARGARLGVATPTPGDQSETSRTGRAGGSCRSFDNGMHVARHLCRWMRT